MPQDVKVRGHQRCLSRVSHHLSSPPYIFSSLSFSLFVLHKDVTSYRSFYPPFFSLYLIHTSTKLEWNVIHLQIGSRTSKSFYKYSPDSPDNHKINLENHTQHCSENSNPSLSLSTEQTFLSLSFWFQPVSCHSDCMSAICWWENSQEKRKWNLLRQ